jgi:hypothetical protein
MCVACGLPTTHSNVVQTLGLLSLLSFGLTTFIGAWWVLTAIKTKGWLRPLFESISKSIKSISQRV